MVCVYICRERERDKERERHTHTHTHTKGSMYMGWVIDPNKGRQQKLI
jgi:hypothetical protein